MPFGFSFRDNGDWDKCRGSLSEARHQVTNRGEPGTTLPGSSPGSIGPTHSFGVTTRRAMKCLGEDGDQRSLADFSSR